MGETAREVIARAFGVFKREEEPVLLCDQAASDLVARLDAAGFVIVPKEPTPEMIKTGDDADYDCSEGCSLSLLIDDEGIAIVYRAMIAASQDTKKAADP